MNKRVFTVIIVVILLAVLGIFVYFGVIKGKIEKTITTSKVTLYDTKPELFLIKNFSSYKLPKITIEGKSVPLIKIPLVTWGGYAALFAANGGISPSKDSLFYKYGKFAVELVREEDPNVQIQNFANGTYPILWSTMDMMPLLYHILKQDKNSRPKVFGLFDWSKGGDAIVMRDTIKSIKDIKGKTVVTSANTPSNFFLLWYLAQLNISPSEMIIKYTDDAIKAADAFGQDSKIDLCVTWSPFYFDLTDPNSKSYVKGAKILITSKDANQLIADCYLARTDFINEHPDIIEAFNRAMMEGADILKNDRQKVFKDMATLFKLPGGPKDSEAMLQDVYIPNFPENQMFFDLNYAVSAYKIFNLSQEYYKNDGTLPKDINYDAEFILYTEGLKNLRSQNLFANQINNIKGKTNEKSFEMADLESKNVVLAKDIQIYFDQQKTDFNFNENSENIEKNKDYLKLIAEQMEVMGTTIVMLIGHLDTTKEEEFKKQGQQIYLEAKSQAKYFSKMRAEFIKKLLVEKYNCPEDRIKTMGMGWDNPIDPLDQAKNRRVEVKFYSFE